MYIQDNLIGYFDLVVKGITAMVGVDLRLISKFLAYADGSGETYGANIDAGTRGALSLLKKEWVVFAYVLVRGYIHSSKQQFTAFET